MQNPVQQMMAMANQAPDDILKVAAQGGYPNLDPTIAAITLYQRNAINNVPQTGIGALDKSIIEMLGPGYQPLPQQKYEKPPEMGGGIASLGMSNANAPTPNNMGGQQNNATMPSQMSSNFSQAGQGFI